ncbi:MAG: hypothetical protein Q9171_002108 [Xanthocarpia ochracea]
MLLLGRRLFYLSYLISAILAVTDYSNPQFQDATLKVLWAECQKHCVNMEVNKIYAFRQRDDASFAAHTRLVVGHIWKDDEEDDSELWTFDAYWFDMRYTMKRPTDAIWGGKCQTNNGEWECRDGNVFKFKGETRILRFDRIEEIVGDEADALITKNDCYNLAFNNCKIFASRLAKRIQKPPTPAAPPAPPSQPFDMTARFEID